METANSEKIPLISLIGAPNSGKTTLFNCLSGKNYKTVNYPGSTVEYSVAPFLPKYNLNASVLDTPGIISLYAASPDEQVSIDSLSYHPDYGAPDLILVSVDSSQISRHLLLVKQMIHSQFKIIVVLTMGDILARKGYKVSESILSERLGCDVVRINSKTGEGIERLVELIKKNLEPERIIPFSENKKEENYSLFDSFFLKKCHHDGSQRRGGFFRHRHGGHHHGHHHHNVEHHRHHFDEQYLKDSHKLMHIFKEIENIERESLVKIQETIDPKKLDKVNKQFTILNNKPDPFTVKIDRLLLHKYWGIVFFLLIMAAMFTCIFWLASPLIELINTLFAFLASSASNALGNNWLGDLVTHGIIDGIGAVFVFLPQIIILFLILGLLEDSGYLARGAMLVDKPLSKIGLNGKSFVPMLSGFACAIPATLATRTISNRRERFLTIFILPLMTCSARLPVYALLVAFITPVSKPWIGGITMTGIYIAGILVSVIVAAIINRFPEMIIKEKDESSFILELPTYKRPVWSIVANNTYMNSKHYIRRAGPIILTLSLVLWFLTYFPNSNPTVNENNKTQEQITEARNEIRLESSYASSLGKFIEPVMNPIGLDWRVGTALVSTFAAREVFVSSLAVIFKVTASGENIQESLLKTMREAKISSTGQQLFTPATIAGLIVFFMFALQCISTIAISHKETGGWRIPVMQFVFYSGAAYLLTFITVNGLRALGIQ